MSVYVSKAIIFHAEFTRWLRRLGEIILVKTRPVANDRNTSQNGLSKKWNVADYLCGILRDRADFRQGWHILGWYTCSRITRMAYLHKD